ncbi:hypothetical protein [Sanyastnella coralliicola]|uniref:hypothetical protein n=1 Tax=Sanyastnella coralliicola TaxID=3069118 RepID=UPI0027BAD60F|nr:hypothetical protein [Longitalea sp. SCSIO 12813]
MNDRYLKIYLVLLPIVVGVSYYITGRIRLRAQQLAENDMEVKTDATGLIYALVIAAAFSILYWIVVKDLTKKQS